MLMVHWMREKYYREENSDSLSKSSYQGYLDRPVAMNEVKHHETTQDQKDLLF